MANNDIIVRLRLAAEEFSQGWKRGLKEFEDESQRIEERIDFSSEQSALSRGKKIGLAMAAGIGSVAAVIKTAVEGSMSLAEGLDTSSKEIGVHVELLQEWRYAAQQTGVGANDLESNLVNLTRRIGEAAGGNRNAQQAFVDLGLSFRDIDGSARDTGMAFMEFIDRISAVSDPAERARLGTQLLGEEYARLEPMARAGGDAIRQWGQEARAAHAVLTSEQIDNLHAMNVEYEKMKTILSVNVAGTVAANSNAVIAFSQGLSALAGEAVEATSALGDLYAEWVGYQSLAKQNGFFSSFFTDINDVRAAGHAELKAARGDGFNPVGTALGVARNMMNRIPGQAPSIAPKPARTGAGSGRPSSRRTGGGGARQPRESDEERKRKQEAEAAARAEKQFEDAVRRTLEAQADSARLESIRAEQGEVAAAAEQARLDILRTIPEARYDDVDALAKALGYTKDLNKEERERLQNILDGAHTARDNAVKVATNDAEKEQIKEIDRARDEINEKWQRDQEEAVRDVADLYEELFTDGVDSVWKNFKQTGLRVVAEIAAQYTLAMLSGQSTGGVNLGQIAGSVLGRSPLGSLFNAGGGLFGGAAANDNGLTMNRYGLSIGNASDFAGALGILPGDQPSYGAGTAGLPGGKSSLLDQAGIALAASSIVQLTGIGKGGGQMGQMMSMAGSIGGQALGSSIAALGAFGGPVGAIAGAVLGSVLGGVVGKIFKKSKYGEATISGSGVNVQGNSGSREEAAGGAADAIMDSMQSLADALGVTLDMSKGAVTVSQRNKDWRVDETGTGISKVKNGAINFDGDQEAAVAYAIRNLVEDGVLTGISDAAKRILTEGSGDLEAAIEKAVLIESVPKLLKERINPLGAALDKVDAKFRQLAEALYEAGASTEQVAQAKQLWQLERQDVIDQFGDVAASLKEFLLSLQAGSGSPLSFRAQKVEADEAMKVYTDQIAAAQAARNKVAQLKASGASADQIAAAEAAAAAAANKIDQDGFEQTSQLLLSISRNMNASSDQYFEDYDRIRSLTQTAIDLIDQAVPTVGAGSDVFAQRTAENSTTMVNLLGAINDNLISMGGKGISTAQLISANTNSTGSDWMSDPRAYSWAY